MVDQGKATARVGMDGLAANLLGSVQHITVVGEQRWVRQGQKLMTLTGDCETIDMPSPVEGVVAVINPEVIKDPALAVRDPYKEGWVCQIKSSEMETNQRNLMQGPLAAHWMENSFKQLKSMLAEADPALAQDGGQPLPGAFNRLSPERRKQLVKEFFLG
jgi:glycine cleavage system H lipoate-binding protein